MMGGRSSDARRSETFADSAFAERPLFLFTNTGRPYYGRSIMGGKGSGRKAWTAHEHGTASQYVRGCRCAECRRAWREYAHARAVARRSTYYRGGRSVAVPLTPLGLTILRAVGSRTAKTDRDVVEHLLRLHGGSVTFDAPEDAA